MRFASGLVAFVLSCVTPSLFFAQSDNRAAWDSVSNPPWMLVALIVIGLWWLVRRLDSDNGAINGATDGWLKPLPFSISIYLASVFVLGLAVWGPVPEGYDARVEIEREQTMRVAVVFVVGLVWQSGYGLWRLARSKIGPETKRLAGEILFVSAWSYFVRLALTAPNILTDGGTGYRRLQEYMTGMGGLSLLLDLGRGSQMVVGDMWGAMWLPTMLSAVAPVAVLLLANALGFDRRVRLLGGLMLASFPLHAALYRSDFLTGAAVALSTLGLAFLVTAVERKRWEWTWPASLILAYSVLIRPEAIVIGIPVVVFGLPAWREVFRPTVAVAVAWLGCVALMAAFFLIRADGQPGTAPPLFPPRIPYLAWLGDPRVLPPWLWLPLPLAIPALFSWGRRRWHLLVALMISVATVAGPVLRFAGDDDVAHAPMEWPRYGTWLMPWVSIMAAAAVVWMIDRWLSRVAPDGWTSSRIYALFVAVVMATPVLCMDYLGTTYGHHLDETVFRRAFAEVGEECTLVIPDDESAKQGGGGTVEIAQRYYSVAREINGGWVERPRIIGVTEAHRGISEHGALPAGCWYFYEGPFCSIGIRGEGTDVCRDFLARVNAESVLSERVDYIHHRLIVRPDLDESSLIVDDMPLGLYRLEPLR